MTELLARVDVGDVHLLDREARPAKTRSTYSFFQVANQHTFGYLSVPDGMLADLVIAR